MRALSEIPVYWLNFALHTLLVSLLAWGACRLVRDAGRRAFLAVVGMIGIVILPWVTALRPFEVLPEPVAEPLGISGAGLPEWTITIGNPEPASPGVPAAAPPVVSEVRHIDWRLILPIVWIAVAVMSVAVIGLRHWRLVRWARSHRAPTDEEWEAAMGSGVKRCDLRVSEKAETPCVIGMVRPGVVVPAFLFDDGMKAELSWALRHEMEHLRAGDSRMAVLLSLTKAVVWWNPFVHALCAAWSVDRERVCDARAVESAGDRSGYGSFLLDLSERVRVPLKEAVSMASDAGRMKKRLVAILRGERVRGASRMFRIFSSLLVGVVAVAASFTGIRSVAAAEATASGVRSAPSEVSSAPEPSPTAVGERQEEAGMSEKGIAPLQLMISASFMDTAQEIPETGKVLNHDEIELLRRRVAQTVGSDLMILPSVTARNGQSSTMVLVHTDPKVPEQSKDGDFRNVPFVGLSLKVLPEIRGETLHVSIDCLFHFAGGTNFSEMSKSISGGWPAPPEGFDFSKARPVTAKAAVDLKSGTTAVVACEGEEQGRHLTGFFTVTKLDAKGRPLDDAGNVLPEPEQIWHGKTARMSAAIIELPVDGKLGPYWLNQGVLYPSRHLAGILDEARKRGADGVTDLGTTLISEDSPPKPWAGHRAEIRMKLTGKKVFRLSLKMAEGGEIETWGSIGQVIGAQLPPESGGKRRMLLLSFEDPEK